jgi:hypothetical protein
VVDDLARRGDALLALRIADIALVAYPQSPVLAASRARVLHDLRERYAQMNPFRFILYSEWSGRGLSPVQSDPPAPAMMRSNASSQVPMSD